MSKYVIKEVILRQGRAMKSRGEKYQVRERVKVRRSIFQVRRNVFQARLHIGILKARHNYLTYLLGLAFRGRNMKRNVLKAHRFTYFIGGGGPGRQWGAANNGIRTRVFEFTI